MVRERELVYNAYDGQAPVNSENPPTPRSMKSDQGNGCIGSSNEQIDRNVIELLEDLF